MENRALNTTIINSIKNIIAAAPDDVDYDVSKFIETKGVLNTTPKYKVTKVSITIKEPLLNVKL